MYTALQKAVRHKKHEESIIRDYIRPFADCRILDIGCGPANSLEYFMPLSATYVGFDLSPEYIKKAGEKYASYPKATFHCSNVSDFITQNGEQQNSFDIVMATYVLHHLDDEESLALFRIAKSALKPGGRLITTDGCKKEGDHFISRTMLRYDRGKFVRNEEGYASLARKVFPKVKTTPRNDLTVLRISAVVMECEK